MKKTIVAIIAFTVIFASCNSTGNKTETNDADTVKTVINESTVTFNKIEEGSYLNWTAFHLGRTSKRFGKVFLKDAEILVNENKVSNATITVDMLSLTVENFDEGDPKIEKLKSHLLDNDFFKTETYPTSKFELTNTEPSDKDGYAYIFTGNLTILETTKSISFYANANIDGDKINIHSEEFTIDRTDWNLTYNTEGTEGVAKDYLIANDVIFKIDITLSK